MDLLHLLQSLEQALHHPDLRADPAAVERLLCDDFREFGASGRIWNKPEVIEQLRTEAPYPIVSQDFACQQLSPTLASLNYVAISPHRRSLRTSIWRLEESGWRILFHQGTIIPPGDSLTRTAG